MIPIGIKEDGMKKFILKTLGSIINIGAIVLPKLSANYAFNLLCKVRKVPVSEKGRLFFERGTATHLKAKGHSVVWHSWGTGEKNVVFLHGWMSNSQRWLPYAKQLDHSKFTLHAIDLPGHGLATGDSLNLEICRDALDQVLTRIGPVDTIVGHSLGSLVTAYTYLNNRNIAVEKFVIMGSPSGMDAIFVYFKQMLGLSEKAIHNLGHKINSILKLPHTEVNLAHFFQQVSQPVLLIHERSDRITPYQPIALAANNNENIQQFITEDQDHNLKGKQVVNKVIQFINK